MDERGGGNGGSARVCGARRAVAALAGLLGLTGLVGVGPLWGQGLADYDYANLGFRGIGIEAFVISPNDVETTAGIGARLNLGYLGPHVRVMPRFAYWDSQLQQDEVDKLATRLEDLIEGQGQARPSVDLSTIDRSAVILGTDVQWLPVVTGRFRPYLGVGSEVYFLNGSGDAINGTFVEDALDLFTAGISGVLGLEFDVNSNGISVYLEGRGALAADVNSGGFTGGVAFTTP
ncbi:MAG: hypothetical protein ACE5HQ_05775 [Gemmatimonadota bacterium]